MQIVESQSSVSGVEGSSLVEVGKRIATVLWENEWHSRFSLQRCGREGGGHSSRKGGSERHRLRCYTILVIVNG